MCDFCENIARDDEEFGKTDAMLNSAHQELKQRIAELESEKTKKDMLNLKISCRLRTIYKTK